MTDFSTILKSIFTGENPKKPRAIENKRQDAGKGASMNIPPAFRDFLKIQGNVFGSLVFFMLLGAILFPFIVLLHRVFPYTGWWIPVLVGFAAQCCLFWLLRKVKFTVWSVIGAIFITLTVTSLVHKYTFRDLYYDYRGFVFNISNEKKSLIDVFTQKPFPRYRDFLKASHFTPEVRQYSLKAATKNFPKQQKGDEWQYVQYFSIFKEVNAHWQYVSDPAHRDYIAPASESMETLCGDCDDYSVLMAACITSIGGTVRLVRTPSHVYPELKIESKEDFAKVKKLIRNKLFKKEVAKKTIYYHTDGYGDIWINLDYTAKYPGGKFLYDDIISVLEIP